MPSRRRERTTSSRVRHFGSSCKRSAAAVASRRTSSATSSRPRSSSVPAGRSLKGLLVGFGSIGRRHLTNLHDLGVQEWALVHTGRGSLPVELPAPATIYANLDQALQDESPAFAVVANPTSLHVPTAQACLDAGCHVLLEKPVSHSLSGLDRLAETASSSRGDVLVGFQFRFHPALQRMAELFNQRTSLGPRSTRGSLGASICRPCTHGRTGERLCGGSRSGRWSPPHDLPSLRLPALVVRRADRGAGCADRRRTARARRR